MRSEGESVCYRMYACKADGKWFPLRVGCETRLTAQQVEFKKRWLAGLKTGYLGREFPVKKLRVVEETVKWTYSAKCSIVIAEEEAL